MVDIVILNRYIFTVFSYQFAILHRTSVSFLRVLQWFLLGLHVSNYTVFYCHFEYQSKKLGVCPHLLQTVSSGVLDGKLRQNCLTCSIWYRFFLSYPIIAMLLSEVNLGPDPAPGKVEGSRIASFVMSVSYTGLAAHPVFFSVYR